MNAIGSPSIQRERAAGEVAEFIEDAVAGDDVSTGAVAAAASGAMIGATAGALVGIAALFYIGADWSAFVGLAVVNIIGALGVAGALLLGEWFEYPDYN